MSETATVSSGLLPFVEQGRYLTIPQRGVIHVGANDGAEVRWYIDRDMTPILCFEPNPDAYERGVRRWIDQPSVTFVPAALGSEDRYITIHVPEDGDDEKTSRYHPIPTAGHDWTHVPLGDTLTVPLVRFDHWARGRDLSAYGTLVVDVQGMELEVLQGFGDLLQDFTYLCVELSERPMYEGEAPADAVIAYLAEQGFKRETDVEEHHDVLFSRA